MELQTVQKLNQINKNFYSLVSEIWNPSPNYYWEGWDKILPFTAQYDDLNVLDIGCGNGRFYNFLSNRLHGSLQLFDYLGIDYSRELLKQSLTYPEPNKTLVEFDLVSNELLLFLKQNLFKTSYNLICAFGVFHHIPGASNRRDLFTDLTKLLAPGGILILTTWQFLEVPRLAKRVVDRQSDYKSQIFDTLNLVCEDLESGDYILDWVKKVRTFRYAHYFEQEEIQLWIDQNRMKLVASFASDGRSGKRNRYYIVEK